MRAIGGLLVVIAILALMIGGLQAQSDTVQGPAVDNGTNATADAKNMTDEYIEITGDTVTTTLVWGGFVAFAFVGIGLLVAYGPRGR